MYSLGVGKANAYFEVRAYFLRTICVFRVFFVKGKKNYVLVRKVIENEKM